MFPLGLVTMLFLVLFVWGCAGKERRGRRHNKSVNNSKRWACERGSMHIHVHPYVEVCVLVRTKALLMLVNRI